MHEPTQMMCLPGQPAFEVTNSGYRSPDAWFFDWARGGVKSDSGVRVNGYTALTHCPIWQGVNIIAGDVGQVSCKLYRNEFTEQPKHPISNVLRRPNALQTPSVWKETMLQWALIWGNGVSWIIRDRSNPFKNGNVTALIPLRPDCLWPELEDFDGAPRLTYQYSSPTTGKQYTFFPWEVLHIQGLTGDGVWGYPLFQIAKNTIGHGLALQRHGNMTFSHGALPGGVLEHPGKLGAEARSNLREEWQRLHGGSENAGRIAILWEGMKFHQMAMTNLDAQWIEARRIGVYEAAALLNLPPHKLGAMEDSSVRANLEEQNADYAQRTLARWFNRMSEEMERKLLSRTEFESGEFAFVWDLSQFLRGDIDTTSTVIDRLIKAEVMNRNEGRRWFRLPPYEGGDKFGSPAINPQPRDGEEPANDDPPSTDPENRLNAARSAVEEALLASLTHVVEKENHALERAAKGAKNFVEWVEEFYCSNGHNSMLKTSVETIAGKTAAAAKALGCNLDDLNSKVAVYGLMRRKELLELCSHITASELPIAIQTMLVTAPESVARRWMEETIHGD